MCVYDDALGRHNKGEPEESIPGFRPLPTPSLPLAALLHMQKSQMKQQLGRCSNNPL